MQLVATGMLNKQVGGELEWPKKPSRRIVPHVMQKLGITSVAELMVSTAKAEVHPSGQTRARSNASAALAR